jgi:O-antigen ligase
MASSGHPLVLGYLLEIAFGFWLYLQGFFATAKYRVGPFILIWAGLLACVARGAWIASVVTYFAYAALGPRVISRLFKSLGLLILGLIVLSFTPLGDKIISVLPFFGGSIDSASYVYRQQLLERSWQIIQESPFFGDQSALLKMQDLRQGEGIIDLINAYISVLLANGFVGLSLLLGFVLTALLKTIAYSRRTAARDPDTSKLGISLAACLVGTLFYLLDGGLGGGVERMFYVLAGFAAAYSMNFAREVRYSNKVIA